MFFVSAQLFQNFVINLFYINCTIIKGCYIKIYFILIIGYFTHVTTLAEVKEQVLKYIPVMARPMVMYRDKHPIQWTGVYADIEVKLFLGLFFWSRFTCKMYRNCSETTKSSVILISYDAFEFFVKNSEIFLK